MRKEPERRYASVERARRRPPPPPGRRGPCARAADTLAVPAREVRAAAPGRPRGRGRRGRRAGRRRSSRPLREARRARIAEARAQRRFDDVRKLAELVPLRVPRRDPGPARLDTGARPRRQAWTRVPRRPRAGVRRRPGAAARARRGLPEGRRRRRATRYQANLGDLKGALESYAKAIALLWSRSSRRESPTRRSRSHAREGLSGARGGIRGGRGRFPSGRSCRPRRASRCGASSRSAVRAMCAG